MQKSTTLPILLRSALLVALVFAAGQAGLRNGFLNYDDPEVVLDNPLLKDPGLPEVMAAFATVRDAAYLPLYTIALMPEARLGATGWHAGSLVWHALVALAVQALFGALTRNPRLSFFAAALFAVHPVAVESVAWISGRKDQVSLLLLLLGLIAWLRWLEGGSRQLLWLSGLAFVLGPFAKASVVVFPLLAGLLALHLQAQGRIAEGRRYRVPLIVFAILCAGITALHFTIARQMGTIGVAANYGPSEGVFVLLEALGRYGLHLVFPYGLSLGYVIDPRASFGAFHALGILLLCLLLAGLWAYFRPPRGLFVFAFLWIAISLLPFNNIFPRSSIPLADRYLAVALPAFGLILARGLLALPRHSGTIGFVLLVAVFGILSDQRTREFANGETIGRAAMREEPASPLGPTLVAEALLERAHGAEDAAALRAEALELLIQARAKTEALGDEARVLQARIRLGDALLALNRFEEAERELSLARTMVLENPERATRLGTDVALLRHNWTQSLLGLGRVLEARRELDDILGATPNSPHARFAAARLDLRQGLETGAVLGEQYKEEGQGRVNRALDALLGLERELATSLAGFGPHEARTARDLLDPLRRDLGAGLLAAHWRKNRLFEATSLVDRQLREAPESPAGYLYRSELKTIVGAPPNEIVADLLLALSKAPRDPSLLARAAVGLRGVGENKRAAGLLRRALAMAPDNPLLQREMASLLLASAEAHQKAERPQDALTALLEARRHAPEDVFVLQQLAELLESQGAYEDAAKSYEQIAVIEPNSEVARLGRARWKQWQGLQILSRIKKELQKHPLAERPAVERALRDEAIGRFREALELGGEAPELGLSRTAVREAALPVQRDAAKGLREQGVRELKAGSLAAAIELLQKARDTDGGDLETRWLLGLALSKSGKTAEAIAELEIALALDPNDLRALSAAAPLLYIKGRFEESEELCTRFLELSRRHPEQDALGPEIRAMEALSERLKAKGKDP